MNKPKIGWIFYDAANSAFATSILSVLFGVYLSTMLVPPEGFAVGPFRIPGESLWGYVVSASMALVLFLSPPLGIRADRRGAHAVFLKLWAGAGILSTGMLFTAKPGRVWWSILWTLAAVTSFEMSLVFYNALLNYVSTPQEKGWVSGLGFAAGYIGGGLCLALNLAVMMNPEAFRGTADPTFPYRVNFLIVAAWWLVFSLPSFFWIRERAPLSRSPTRVPWREILSSFRENPNVGRFLLAFLFYNDGIQTVIVMAAVFGAKEIGLSAGKLALCFLMIQFVAFFGALVFGRFADRWGHKKAVLISLGFFILVTAWGVVMKSEKEFWILGAVVGLVLGGSQSASRSLYANLISPEKSGELFAFYSVVGKAAALIGPFVFAVVSQAANLRAAVASLAVFFVVGMALLTRVKEEGSVNMK